jgi:signal transduction histidine kinase
MSSLVFGLIGRSIGAKIIAAVLVMFLLVLSLTWWSIKSSSDSYVDLVSNNSIALAKTSTRDIDHQVLDQRDVLERFSQRSAIRATLSESNAWFGNLSDPTGYVEQTDENWTSVSEGVVTPFMQELIRGAVSQQSRESLVNGSQVGPGFFVFREITVTNTYGAVVAMTQKTPDYRQVYKEWWQSAWTNGSYISDVEYDNHVGILGLEVSYRVHDTAGIPLGVIMGFVDINSVVWSSVGGTATSLYSSGEIVLLNSDRGTIFSTEPFKPLGETSIFASEQSLNSSSGSFVGEENSRTRQYYFCRSDGYADYGGHGWQFVISYDRQQMMSPLTNLRNVTLVLSASVGIVSLLGTYLLLSRSVRKPLTEFRKATAEITRGNLEKRVHITSRDEIGELASDFNIMTAKLEEQVKGLEDRVDERTILISKLRSANRDLAQFAYVASHDLQEPLRMISSYLQLLSKRYSGHMDKDADEFINYAVDGANRLQRMINDLLTFSRVGTRGKLFAKTDIGVVLGFALTNLEIAIEEAHAKITHSDLPTVKADEVQLLQLFQNLIENAIKFRSDKPLAIHVSAERGDGEWIFSVKDNGIGIDPQYRDRLFVIFQRLHSAAKYPGTGIGLALCKRIVERHSGRIWVESELGKGSTFRFTIPDKKEEAIVGGLEVEILSPELGKKNA